MIKIYKVGVKYNREWWGLWQTGKHVQGPKAFEFKKSFFEHCRVE